MPRIGFRDQGIEPADGFMGDGFVVRPLVPSDVALDYDAVISSREVLFHSEQDPPYPPEDFLVGDNLKDVEKMDSRHRGGSRYTYTVMNADETQALGCVYFLPNDDRIYLDADVSSLGRFVTTPSFRSRALRWCVRSVGVLLKLIGVRAKGNVSPVRRRHGSRPGDAGECSRYVWQLEAEVCGWLTPGLSLMGEVACASRVSAARSASGFRSSIRSACPTATTGQCSPTRRLRRRSIS